MWVTLPLGAAVSSVHYLDCYTNINNRKQVLPVLHRSIEKQLHVLQVQ